MLRDGKYHGPIVKAIAPAFSCLVCGFLCRKSRWNSPHPCLSLGPPGRGSRAPVPDVVCVVAVQACCKCTGYTGDTCDRSGDWVQPLSVVLQPINQSTAKLIQKELFDFRVFVSYSGEVAFMNV